MPDFASLMELRDSWTGIGWLITRHAQHLAAQLRGELHKGMHIADIQMVGCRPYSATRRAHVAQATAAIFSSTKHGIVLMLLEALPPCT